MPRSNVRRTRPTGWINGRMLGPEKRVLPVIAMWEINSMTFNLSAHCKAPRPRLRPHHAWVGILLIASAAQAELSSTLGELMLPPGSAQAALGKGMRLFGMPVDIRVFDTPEPVAQVARGFSERYAGLSSLGIYPEHVTLTGQVNGQLWVVSLAPVGPRHTRGSVSVLSSSMAGNTATDLSATDEHAMFSHAWLPKTARLRLQLEQDEDDGNGRTLQQVWTFTSSITSTWQAVRHGLQQHHWQLEAETTTTSRWRRERSSLQLTMVEVAGGSGMLLHQHDEWEAKS